MGRPIRHSSPIRRRSQRQSARSVRSMGYPRSTRPRQPRPATSWDSTVARAAPKTSRWNVRINTVSKTMFKSAAPLSQITGVRLSPSARRTPAVKL